MEMGPRSPFTFPAFDDVLATVDRERLQQFSAIEDRFVEAMSEFDQLRAAGVITSGQNQTKGLFFNELIVRLLERCAGLGVAKRGKRPGVLLEVVDLDLCFPEHGRPLMIAETKMLGTPQHPGNKGSAKPKGRPTCADFDKRIREVALNVIDLKLADLEGSTTRIDDIASWIQSTMPRFFGIWGMRIADDADHQGVIGRAQYLANSYANGVGLALYRATDPSTPQGRVSYEKVTPPRGMSIDDALVRMCRMIKSGSSTMT
jgi:hypothetical protein